MIKNLISDLTSDKVKVSSALKVSKTILSLVEDKELQTFIKRELVGYEWDETPDYRTLQGSPKANYRRNIDGQLMVLPLNFSEINEKIGINFNERKITSPIPEIENLLDKVQKGKGEICVSFSPDQLKLLWENTNALNDNGWSIESAWWAFPSNLFSQIYSRTQDILIDILIRINKEEPQVDKELDFMNSKENKPSTIQTNIHGNVTGSNLGIGTDIRQKDMTVNYNDEINEVIDKIVQLGFDKSDTNDLKDILIEKKKSNKPIGKQILTWVGKMTNKAIEKGIEHKIPQLTETISDYL